MYLHRLRQCCNLIARGFARSDLSVRRFDISLIDRRPFTSTINNEWVKWVKVKFAIFYLSELSSQFRILIDDEGQINLHRQFTVRAGEDPQDEKTIRCDIKDERWVQAATAP